MLLKLQYELATKLKELKYEFEINYNTEYDLNNYVNIKIKYNKESNTYGCLFSNELIYSSSIECEYKQFHIFENLEYSESFKSINEVITFILSKLK